MVTSGPKKPPHFTAGYFNILLCVTVVSVCCFAASYAAKENHAAWLLHQARKAKQHNSLLPMGATVFSQGQPLQGLQDTALGVLWVYVNKSTHTLLALGIPFSPCTSRPLFRTKINYNRPSHKHFSISTTIYKNRSVAYVCRTAVWSTWGCNENEIYPWKASLRLPF